jgi:CoA:oxalate CoA-transferase
MQPFTGLRVLDLTRVLAGPYCGYQMALLGADVIKVEPPGKGETLRWRPTGDLELSRQGKSLSFFTQSSNKRFMTLDIDSDAGQEVFLRLAASCDVVIENLRTGSMEKRGIGFDAVRARRPDVVWCAISGYGRNGPKRRDAAYDSVLQAWSGYMSLNGPKEGPTWKSGPPIVDYAAGLAAAYAVSAALLQRNRTGEGQYIDVSLLDANLTLMASVLTQCANGGIDPQPVGNDAGNGDPCSTVYDTVEGKLAIGLNEEHQAQALLRHLGGEGLACEARFATDGARRKYQMELRAAIQSRLRTQDSNRWERELNAIGVPAARVRSVPEVMAEEQFAARGFMHLFAADESGVGKAVAVPLAPFRYAHSGPGAVTPPKSAGADTDAILEELGYNEKAIHSLRQAGVL